MAGATQPNQAAHAHFVLICTLLYLIDPVRGKATVHSLDIHPKDESWERRQNLLMKFLDSFALISSTSKKGGETASAACLEQAPASRAVLRLARNLGVSKDCKLRLQCVLDALASNAQRGDATPHVEDEILRMVVDLDRDKICYLLQKFRKTITQDDIDRAMLKINQKGFFSKDVDSASFKVWISNLPVLASLPTNADLTALIPHIRWAVNARWVYSDELETLFFPNQDDEMPKWIGYIHKLGRYFAATKAMIKCATKNPDLFASLRIETLQAPAQKPFLPKLNEKSSLAKTLERLDKVSTEEVMARLGQVWVTKDPEKRFRTAYLRHNLTVHAEMQLLSFYDHNRELTPSLLFMGTSKKACFLCHSFMSRHQLGMTVKACHQKMYPSWMPAPCSSSIVQKAQKSILWELTRHLEKTAVDDLTNRLGIRRPLNPDSTAGPSLTTMSYLLSLQSRRDQEARDADDGALVVRTRQHLGRLRRDDR